MIPEVPALLVSARDQTVKQNVPSHEREQLAAFQKETLLHTFHPTGTLNQHRSRCVWPTEAAGTQAGLAPAYAFALFNPKALY